MAGTLRSSPGLVVSPQRASDYKFVVDRSDNGDATITLYHREVVGQDGSGNPITDWVIAKDASGNLIQQTNAGWDDAIPWKASSDLTLRYNGLFAGNNHSWRMSPDPYDDRNGILLHVGSQATPSEPVHGCIGATPEFLNDAYEALKGLGNQAITLEVNNDFDYTFNIASSASEVTEGSDIEFTISLTGAGASGGVSKDVWVRLDIDNKSAPQASYPADFTIEPSTAGLGEVKKFPAKNVTTGQFAANYKEGIYVKIPKENPSVTYKLKAIDEKNNVVEGNENIIIKIDDYLVRDAYKGRTEYYSDFLTQPGVLLKGKEPEVSIVLKEKGKLISEHLSGGIEGLLKTYKVGVGDVISYGFQAYSVPDKITITDGVSQVDTGGFVSGFHSGSLTAATEQITVIVVGSSAGTAWDLDLTSTPPANQAQAASAFGSLSTASTISNYPVTAMVPQISAALVASAIAFSAAATPVPDATLVTELTQTVTVPADGSATAVSFAAKADTDYLIRLVDRGTSGGSPSTLADGYFQIFNDGDTAASIEAHTSDLKGQAAAFIRASADTTISIVAGSDRLGEGGDAQLEILRASDLTAPIVFLGHDQFLSAVEGGDQEIMVPVYRFGDVSQAATYKLIINASGANPLAADDLVGGFNTLEVTFQPGQTLATVVYEPVDDGQSEGLQTATVKIDPTSLPAESLANAAMLGFTSSVEVSVTDGSDIPSIVFPTLSGADATGSEADGKITFELALSEATTETVSVAYTTVDGSAEANSDYTPTSGTVVFAPGETRKEVTVSILKDAATDPDETLQLKILDRAGVFLDGGGDVLTLTGTIRDSALIDNSQNKPLFGSIDTTTDSAGGQLYAVYEGLLNRAPDALGIEDWAEARESGASLQQIVDSFLHSGEYTLQFGSVDAESNAGFVEELYQGVLNRASDPGGQNNWVAALSNGTSRADVALGFVLSAEHVASVQGAIAAGVFVPNFEASQSARFYHGLLDRAPDAQGLQDWTRALESGASLSSIGASFLGSGEYQAKFGGLSDDAFVESLYLNSLGRTADPAGKASWLASLSGGATRADVAVGITQSAEAESHLALAIQQGWQLV